MELYFGYFPRGVICPTCAGVDTLNIHVQERFYVWANANRPGMWLLTLRTVGGDVQFCKVLPTVLVTIFLVRLTFTSTTSFSEYSAVWNVLGHNCCWLAIFQGHFFTLD